MEFIKLQKDHLVNEQKNCSNKERFSHPAFTRKLHKGIQPCDFSRDEKLIEVELDNGDRIWVDLEFFFGKVISTVKHIFVIDNKNDTNPYELIITGIDVVKVKRTNYIKLIFEYDLPF